MSQRLLIKMGVLAIVAFFSAPLLAEGSTPTLVSGFTWGYLGKLVVALGAVIVFFLLCAWLIRQQPGLGRATAGSLKVVATLPLGTKEKVVVVQAGETQVLLGVKQSQISRFN
ncbi:MAG: flagellar biosynthetic protein FliO, partial [Gammaproteobacteria bacterium]|nr:flagellar biosynthetic protein FliO [Gammaproteobacteria bacterium]